VPLLLIRGLCVSALLLSLFLCNFVLLLVNWLVIAMFVRLGVTMTVPLILNHVMFLAVMFCVSIPISLLEVND
jgi:hypothetical protein